MSQKIYFALLEEIYNNVNQPFSLLQSFNYTTYLFYKKRFKSEISYAPWHHLSSQLR
jgi:hypothetical protein